MFSDILLAVDFDRTLTAQDSTIPQRNLEAIQYFMDNGGAFTDSVSLAKRSKIGDNSSVFYENGEKKRRKTNRPNHRRAAPSQPLQYKK